MGREKARMEEAEAAWDRKAQVESLTCNVCSQQISHSDREIYFETTMCSYCNHKAKKDD